MVKKLEISPGKIYSRLEVIEEVNRSSQGRRQFRCRCSCLDSTLVVVALMHLQSGHTASCGCLQRERTGNVGRTHGLSHTEEYGIWASIIDRCTNPNNHAFDRYNSRGICSRWRNSFEFFLSDMGPRPSRDYSIERRDNNLGYSPDNCYWGTRKEQSNNKSTTIFIKDPRTGEDRPCALLAEEYGIPYHKLYYRLGRGWSVEEALTAPFDASSRWLSKSQVSDVREELKWLSVNEVAEKLNISAAVIRGIKSGRNYRS